MDRKVTVTFEMETKNGLYIKRLPLDEALAYIKGEDLREAVESAGHDCEVFRFPPRVATPAASPA